MTPNRPTVAHLFRASEQSLTSADWLRRATATAAFAATYDQKQATLLALTLRQLARAVAGLEGSRTEVPSW
jgi:hypothetical protein